MKYPFLFLLFTLLLFAIASQAQQGHLLTGYLTDSATAEVLVGATISLPDWNTGTTTNREGFFSLNLPAKKVKLIIEYLGYNTLTTVIEDSTAKVISIKMTAVNELLKEVVVSTENPSHVSGHLTINRLSIQDIKKMPALLGEADVIRSIQMTPGVTTVGEGATGFNVRGGGIDQNLILLDDAPVYNSSHLFGFFSVFNPDAVNDVKLYKAGIPATYGGRVSSLLDIKMKEGSYKKFEAKGGIGSVSSRLSLEGPLIKEKASFIVAARRSYVDMFLKLSPELKDNQAYFYDVNAKANYLITPSNKVVLSVYSGRDVFKFGKQFANSWGNQTASFHWEHRHSDRLALGITATYSKFDYLLGVAEGTVAFDWKASIATASLKAYTETTFGTSATAKFGGGFNIYQLKPGAVTPKFSTSIFNAFEMQQQHGTEYFGYATAEQALANRLTTEYGIRLSIYSFNGPGIIYDYKPGNNGRQVASEARSYKAGQPISQYFNLEPRFSVKYTLNERTSLKASYNRTAQYVHLLSNTTAASPLDMWTTTTNNIKPQLGDQLAAGYFKMVGDNQYDLSAEAFYKYMHHQIDYVDGAQLLLNKHVEADLLDGHGRAYGLEIYAKKKHGTLTGWVSYTLSKTERKIAGINNNQYYRSKYDKPHNLAVVAMYEITKRWSVSATGSYSSGVTTTFPNARYEFQGIVVPYNSTNQRNNYRLPDYHRLDVAATYKFRSNRKFKSELILSVYNLYGRRNPYTVFFRQNEKNARQTEAVRLSILGSPLPSLTYNFQF